MIPSSAHAQQDARARFEAGVEAYDAKDYETALAAFSDAYRIKPHPVVRLNIANCYERLRRHSEAEHQYRRFLEEMPTSPKAAEVKRSLARISKRIGTIHIDVDPSNAQVTINGEQVDPSEPHRVNAGRYKVSATADGYEPRSEEIAVPGGSKPHVRLYLEPSDDRVDQSPETLEAGYAKESAGFGIDEPTDESEPDSKSGIPTGTWIAGGAAVVLAVGALTTGLMAISAESGFEEEVTRSNDLTLSARERMQAYEAGIDAHDRANSLALVSDLFLVGSVATATTAIIFFVTQDDDETPESFTALPALSPSGAGATIRSTF